MEIEDSSAEREENIAAIQASIDDMQAGETGRDAAEIIREVRARLGSQSWQKKFTDFINRAQSRNPDVDDSRESMYPDR